MRPSLGSVACLLLVACKRPGPPEVDAGPVVVARAEAPADASVAARADAGPRHALAPLPKPPPPTGDAGAIVVDAVPLPRADEPLTSVAIGASFNSRILSLDDAGDRIWLSARNLDAFAIAGGPLVRVPDPIQKVPYKPGAENVRAFGPFSDLHVLRWRNVVGRMESFEPALFVREVSDGGPETFRPGSGVPPHLLPHAFVTYRGRGLLVYSSVVFNAGPYKPDDEDGTYLLVADHGKLEPAASVSLPRSFMAWQGSADGEHLALLGTQQLSAEKGPSGIHLVQVGPDGRPRVVRLQATGGDGTFWQSYYEAKVVQRGATTLVTPGDMMFGVGDAWMPSPLAVTLVDGQGKVTHRVVKGDRESCRIAKADLLGDVVYAVRYCMVAGDGRNDLLRLGPDGKTERVDLPRITGKPGGFREATPDDTKDVHACMVHDVRVKGDDLWVWARCGAATTYASDPAVPVLLRRAKKQEPLVLP